MRQPTVRGQLRCQPTPHAAHLCTPGPASQNYGWGQYAGANYALLVNYTCGEATLGVMADVNEWNGIINV